MRIVEKKYERGEEGAMNMSPRGPQEEEVGVATEVERDNSLPT